MKEKKEQPVMQVSNESLQKSSNEDMMGKKENIDWRMNRYSQM